MGVMWVIFCILVGVFASNKGRSGVGWFFLSLLISPLLGAIFVACLKDLKVEADVKQVEMEQQHTRDRVANDERLYEYRLGRVENDVSSLQSNMAGNSQTLNSAQNSHILEEGTKRCPHCGETIKFDAIKCRFCGVMLENVATKQCPYCKEMIRSDAIICKYCKSNLSQGNNSENF